MVQSRSWLRGFLRSLPLPIFVLLFGLLAGISVLWLVDRHQSGALQDIFDETLQTRLESASRQALINFDEHKQSYVYLMRLLANHRRMATYMDLTFWGPFTTVFEDRKELPPWMPLQQFWRQLAQPTYLILMDLDGNMREGFSPKGLPIPTGLLEDQAFVMASRGEKSFVTTLGGAPYFVVTEPIWDTGPEMMGHLVMLLRVDSDFLAASQQGGTDNQAIVAITEPEGKKLLATSDTARVDAGEDVEMLSLEYLITTQSFTQYDDADLNLLFMTLMPRSSFLATSEKVIDLERKQRAVGAGAIIVTFMAVVLLISGRINRVLRRLQEFASRALGDTPEKTQSKTGNQLLILEERVRDVIDLVLTAREQTRTQHESQVEQLESLRAAAMSASADGMITIDYAGNVIDMNATAERQLDKRLSQVLGLELSRLAFDASSAKRFNEMLESYQAPLEKLPIQSDELQGFPKDGHSSDFEVSLTPVHLEDDLLFTVTLRDVGDRKAREREIAALAAFSAESPSPILRINQRGVIVYANTPSEPLLKYWNCRPAQTLPLYWRTIVMRVLEENTDYETEIEASNHRFSLLMTPVKDLGYVNIYARDITAQRLAEDELQRRQDELVHVARLSTMGEMSTGIAHELNQPLSAISNFANGCVRRLNSDVGTKEDLVKALEQIAAQSKRAAEIIKRLRALVTKQQTIRQHINLNEIVNEVCELVAHDIRKDKISLEKKLLGQPLWVDVDTVQIEQVLINLVRNAIDAMQVRVQSERRLLIETSFTENCRAQIRIKDDGAGIPEEQLIKLFDAFYTTKEHGMGMGLAITKTIVEEHSGKIYANSKVGKGSTFYVELPLSSDNKVDEE